MKDVIERILIIFDRLEAFRIGPEFHIKLVNPPYMPLVIERIYGEICIAHYGEQNGDAMRDPEMTWAYPGWNVRSFRNDYAGAYQEVAMLETLGAQIRLMRQLDRFANTWAENLLAQGFSDPEKVTPESLTHPF